MRHRRVNICLLLLLSATTTAGALGKEEPSATQADVNLGQRIAGKALVDDLQQRRSILKEQWILSNLNDADFDVALARIGQDAEAGMTLGELTLRLQRVIAMGADGHAEMTRLLPALRSTQ